MAWIAPRYEAHQRKRWLRPDAYRFAAPGTPEARMPGYLHPWAAVAKAENEEGAGRGAGNIRAGTARTPPRVG